MATLRRIDVLSAAKVCGAVMSGLGLLAGVVYSFGGLIGELWTNTPLNTGTALAFLALVLMPAIYGIAGLVTGAVGAYLFNLSARWVGGIEIDLG